MLLWMKLQAVQRLVHVGHTSERRTPGPVKPIPESWSHEGVPGQNDSGACRQMRIHQRKPVGVMHRQALNGTLAGLNSQITRDRMRVGEHVVLGEPHKFWAACGARCGEE